MGEREVVAGGARHFQPLLPHRKVFGQINRKLLTERQGSTWTGCAGRLPSHMRPVCIRAYLCGNSRQQSCNEKLKNLSGCHRQGSLLQSCHHSETHLLLESKEQQSHCMKS